MESGGSVRGVSSSFTSDMSSYSSSLSSLSGIWEGKSKTSFDSQVQSFIGSYPSTVQSQLEAYANACDKYDYYEKMKDHRKQLDSEYNTAVSNKQGTSKIEAAMREDDKIINETKKEIIGFLNTANGKSLDATELSSSFGGLGKFVNYYQYNYGGEPYSEGSIATSGCGPTSLAMVLTYLTGKEVTPVETARKGNGTYTCSEGTYWSYFGDMAKQYGVKCDQMGSSSSNIVNNLKNGKTLILSMGPGDFTSAGHFIVARGLDKNGNLIVADPNSEDRSNQTWDVGRVASQCKQIWAMST